MKNEEYLLKTLYPSEVYPDFIESKTMASSGKYKRIPVCMDILSDNFTPVEVLKIARALDKQAFLLESASSDMEYGRYSFIGYEPSLELICSDGLLTINELSKEGKVQRLSKEVSHPKEEIRKILQEYKSPKIEGQPPLTGGLVGYFSYDYIKYAEPTLKTNLVEGEGFRDVDLMLFDSLIAFDSSRQRIVLITGVDISKIEDSAYTLASEYEKAVNKLKEMAIILAKKEMKEFPPLELKGELEAEFSKEEYCSMVNKAKDYIKEGDIFQVVLSNPVTAEASGSLFDTYRILRKQNPSPYMFYFSSEDVEIAGASPETLAKLEEGRVYTFPLAGTRPRGKTREEDLENERDLLADEKERAEHNMLVDLGRNDIGKIAKIGSVHLDKYMSIERFSQVMHIGSTVVGSIDSDKDALDAVDAILPAGTLSGAPKIRACEIIEELEQKKRGIYGGAIGYLDFTGNLDTCIGIRLVYKKDGKVCVRSGAGIVYDSIAEKEYQECVNKAKAVVKAINTSII